MENKIKVNKVSHTGTLQDNPSGMNKKMMGSSQLKRNGILFLLMNFLATGYMYAQEKVVDVDINAGGDAAWYSAWWVWVAGIALFIIILVAIVSAGRKA